MKTTKAIIVTVFAVLAVLIIAIAVCGDEGVPRVDDKSSTCSYTYTPPAMPPQVMQPQGPVPIKHAQPILPAYAAPPAPADIGC